MKLKHLLSSLRISAVTVLCMLLVQQSFAQTPDHFFTGSATSCNSIPFGSGTTWAPYRSQFLYLPGDFPTLSATTKGFVTRVYFMACQTTSGFGLSDFQVSVGNTTTTSLTGYVTGLTIGRPAASFTYGSVTTGNWWYVDLPNPVFIDGSQPIVIDVQKTGSTGTPPATRAGGGSTNSTYSASNTHAYSSTSSGGASTRRYSYRLGIDMFEGYPCTDTPKTSVNGPIKVCPNKRFAISPDSFYADATYQWQYSTNGTTWSNFTGVPGLYGEIYDSITAPKWYRFRVTCIANNNLTWLTPPHKVSIAPFYYCYCESSAVGDGVNVGKVAIINTTNDDSIMNKSFLLTGTGEPIFNNSQAAKQYTSYHDSLNWPCLYWDSTYRFVVTQIHAGGTLQPSFAQVYIDYNRDGTYNPNTEKVFVQAIDGTNNPPHAAIVATKIPTTAAKGPTGMRVIISQDTVAGAPCDTLSGYGEVEDYIVEICHRPCDSMVNAGVVVSTDTSMCSGYEYVLTDTTYEKSRSAFNHSWQVSADNQVWFNINNSLNKDTLNRVFTGQPLHYRVRTICLPTHDTAYSNPTEIKVKPGYKCYCYSKAIGGLGVDSSDIGGVSIGPYTSNSGGPHLLNALARYPRTDYTDNDPIELYTDSAYRFSVYHTMPVVEHGDAKVTIFMDFNNDHKYDIPSERIFTGYTTIGNHTLVDNVVIPLNAILDVPTGMRVILNNNVGPNIPSDEACGPYISGETEDYILIFRDKAKLGIAGINGLSGFGLHPNPTTGKFHVQFSTDANISQVNIRVTNLTGQLIQQQSYKHEGGMFDKELDMSNQASGMYFVELEADGQKMMKKLLLQ